MKRSRGAAEKLEGAGEVGCNRVVQKRRPNEPGTTRSPAARSLFDPKPEVHIERRHGDRPRRLDVGRAPAPDEWGGRRLPSVGAAVRMPDVWRAKAARARLPDTQGAGGYVAGRGDGGSLPLRQAAVSGYLASAAGVPGTAPVVDVADGGTGDGSRGAEERAGAEPSDGVRAAGRGGREHRACAVDTHATQMAGQAARTGCAVGGADEVARGGGDGIGGARLGVGQHSR